MRKMNGEAEQNTPRLFGRQEQIHMNTLVDQIANLL